jgi:hypothetical protein
MTLFSALRSSASTAPTATRADVRTALACASRQTRTAAVALAAGTAAALACMTALSTASTQTAAAQEVVSSTAKGIVGGALVGGEVVMITEAIIGVKPTWAYLVGGGLGAAAGGVGGYFIEQSSTDGRVPSYILAGGLALMIPTLVVTLNATRYTPRAHELTACRRSDARRQRSNASGPAGNASGSTCRSTCRSSGSTGSWRGTSSWHPHHHAALFIAGASPGAAST